MAMVDSYYNVSEIMLWYAIIPGIMEIISKECDYLIYRVNVS
jgi:hypothetical protein